jgi:hypothetical protein
MTLDVTRNGASMRVDPPCATTPFWSDNADGRPLSLPALVLADPERRALLEVAHADGVRQLLLAAFTARQAGEYRRARELFARAGRLCTEPLGHWPIEVLSADPHALRTAPCSEPNQSHHRPCGGSEYDRDQRR